MLALALDGTKRPPFKWPVAGYVVGEITYTDYERRGVALHLFLLQIGWERGY